MTRKPDPEKRVKITFYVNPEMLEIANWITSVKGGNLGDTHRKAWEAGISNEIAETMRIEKIRSHIKGDDEELQDSEDV